VRLFQPWSFFRFEAASWRVLISFAPRTSGLRGVNRTVNLSSSMLLRGWRSIRSTWLPASLLVRDFLSNRSFLVEDQPDLRRLRVPCKPMGKITGAFWTEGFHAARFKT